MKEISYHENACDMAFIQLPYKGDVTMSDSTKKLKAAIGRTYYAAELHVIAQTEKLSLTTLKTMKSFQATSNC